MVEATPQGDGITRPFHYASFRTDKQASPGYSAELISKNVPQEYYDDLDSQPRTVQESTMISMFRRNVREHPNQPFLGMREDTGERDDKGKPIYGDYHFRTNTEVNEMVENFAKGVMNKNLCPEIEGEDKQWRFMGIWSKNREEWSITLLAGMLYCITTVGFYDAMSLQQVDFILKQTEMQTITCTKDYALKIIKMKKEGMAESIKNLVVVGEPMGTGLSAEEEQDAADVGIQTLSFSEVSDLGQTDPKPVEFRLPGKDDIYIFSYTSGTTGDSKGVKLSHNNILTNALATIIRLPVVPGEAIISYLPYTHSFEQVLFGLSLVQQLRIGFYQGDPLKIVEDCQALKPSFFPSVPRLYNKIYSKIKARLDGLTGCKAWLARKGFESKMHYMQLDGRTTSGCYDKLIFRKMAEMLGGQVKAMVTGSAPIDKAVIDYLKICFCCPIVEGYGLTESAAGSCVMDLTDPVTGHVGGPVESVKIRLKDLPEMDYLSSDKPYPRGEICMKGPGLFTGYYKRPDKTAEAFDAEGWFLTGDVAQIYPNGSIKIIDRSKNIFKLSQGEYIAPEKIENIFVLSSFVDQTFIYGDSLKNACVAVIVANEDAVKGWAGANGKGGSQLDEVLQDELLQKAIKDDLMKLAVDNKLSSLEKPKQFTFTMEPFTIENDLLTPTFKLKRNVANKFFKAQIDAMYAKQAEAEAALDSKRQ